MKHRVLFLVFILSILISNLGYCDDDNENSVFTMGKDCYEMILTPNSIDINFELFNQFRFSLKFINKICFINPQFLKVRFHSASEEKTVILTDPMVEIIYTLPMVTSTAKSPTPLAPLKATYTAQLNNRSFEIKGIEDSSRTYFLELKDEGKLLAITEFERSNDSDGSNKFLEVAVNKLP